EGNVEMLLQNNKNIKNLIIKKSNFSDVKFLQQFTRLERLDLRYNEIRSIPLNFFESFPNLAYYNITNNKITEVNFYIPSINENNTNVIDLSNNNIHLVRKGTLLFAA